MSTHHAKIPIPAAHLNGLSLGDDSNVLSAIAGGGKTGTDGRPVLLTLTDADIRAVIARLALDPKWSPAIDEAARIGFPLGDQATPEELEGRRRHLTRAMTRTGKAAAA